MPSQARQGKARQSYVDELMARQGEAFLFGKEIMETNTFDYIWAEYVNPNPYFAIEDNAIGMAAKALPAAQPTNYNGARSMPDEAMVRAVYNGTGGIYTRREAEMYNMEIKGEFVL